MVEDGQIVETGKHDELIRVEGGKYLQLVKLQLGGAINPDGCALCCLKVKKKIVSSTPPPQIIASHPLTQKWPFQVVPMSMHTSYVLYLLLFKTLARCWKRKRSAIPFP